MTNIVGQLFKSLDPWPGFQITSFKIQVSPVDGRKTLILDLRPVEGSMPICSRCRHEAPLVHSYVSRRIKECSLLGYFVELNVTFRRVDCLHCKGHPMEGERQKFCVHGIIGARQTGASNEHEHQTQFS